MNRLETRVPPLVVLALFAGTMFVAARLWPSFTVTFPGQGLSAIAVVVAGVAVIAAAVRQFGRSATTTDPVHPEAASALVRSGVFGRSRNPMYLGMALLLTALGVWMGHASAPLLLAGFVAYIARFQIVPEERALRAHFGERFDRYTAEVRRWI